MSDSVGLMLNRGYVPNGDFQVLLQETGEGALRLQVRTHEGELVHELVLHPELKQSIVSYYGLGFVSDNASRQKVVLGSSTLIRRGRENAIEIVDPRPEGEVVLLELVLDEAHREAMRQAVSDE